MLRLEVLGPARVQRGGRDVPLRQREREVLAALALRHPGPTDLPNLIDALWPSGPPPTARTSPQNHVARTRRTLSDDVVVTVGRAYRLGPGWVLDIDEAAALADEGRALVAAGEGAAAVAALVEAIELAQGDPFADLPDDDPLVVSARARALERHRQAEDDLLVALLAAGRVAEAVAEGAALTAAESFREVRWAAFALSLYRDGQRREALRALHVGQTALRDLVGLDGGPVLRSLEALVLADHPDATTGAPAVLLGRAPNAVAAVPPIPEATGTVDGTSIRALLEAGRAAHREARFAEAADLLERAGARAGGRGGEAGRRALTIRLQHAVVLRHAGDSTHVGLVWEVVRTAEEADDRVMFAEAAAALCALGPHIRAGSLPEGVAGVVERAIAGCHGPAARARRARGAVRLYSLSGHFGRCRAHFESSLADARITADDAVVLEALMGTYVALAHPDDWPQRAELAGEMLTLAERLDDDDARVSALHVYFSTQVAFADPLLRTTFARQEALARALGSAGRRWMVGYQRACVAHLDGRLDDALEIAAESEHTAPVDPSRAATTALMARVPVRTAQGRAADLVPELDRMIVDQPGLPEWRAVAAWPAALAGGHDRVAEECATLDQGRALPRDQPWSAAAALLARAVARVGAPHDIEALRSLIGPYAGLVTWFGSGSVGPFDVALAELELARGDHTAARAARDRAQHLVDRLRAPVFQPDIDAISARLA